MYVPHKLPTKNQHFAFSQGKRSHTFSLFCADWGDTERERSEET